MLLLDVVFGFLRILNTKKITSLFVVENDKIIFSKKIEQDCPKMPPLMLRRKRNESFFCKNTFLTNFCTKLLNLL